MTRKQSSFLGGKHNEQDANKINTAQDWRLRRVGWAWVAYDKDHTEIYGAYGGMKGPQTVPW